jgi:predicted DNA repair protein MutK
MAGASLLALLDDISSVLDDVALLTKAASKKTAGVLGDDIALNAQQVTGVVANRELPVVWAVAKGSFVNKLILVPLALAISAFLPVAITPLLMIGGVYLCYEGAEKIIHTFFHRGVSAHLDDTPSGATPEHAKIKGAIRTDFILSAEIIAITLGTVASAAFPVQASVVAGVALIMTVGVYGLVAGIVKLDDAGLYLSQRRGDAIVPVALRGLGAAILAMAPYFMKTLSIVGTAAMFLVGGGILLHGIPGAEHYAADLMGLASLQSDSFSAAAWKLVGPAIAGALTGLAAGFAALGAVTLIERMRS